MSGTRAGSVSVQQFIVRTAAAPLPSLSGSSAQHCTVGCLVAGGCSVLGYGGHFLVCSSAVCCLSATDTLTIYLHSPASTYLLHSPIWTLSTLTNTNINSTLNNSKPSKACEVQRASDSELNASKSQFPTAVKEREYDPIHNPAWLKFCFYDQWMITMQMTF